MPSSWTMDFLHETWFSVSAGAVLLAISLYYIFSRNAYGKPPGHLKSLAKLPGPIPLPFIGNLHQLMLNGLHHYHLTLTKWAKTYGKLYRLSLPGKTLLVVSDPTLIPTVLGSASGTGLPKSFICEQARVAAEGKNIVTAHKLTDPEWRDARTQLIPAFSSHTIRENFFPIVSAKAHILARKITDVGPDKALEMQDAFRRLALDVILEAGFGINNEALMPVAASAQNPLLSKMDKAPWVNPFAIASAIDKDAAAVLRTAWLELAKQVRANGKLGNTDFTIAACLARIVDLKTGQQLNDEQLASQIAGTVTAGVDPIAQTCTWVLFALSQERSTQDKVARELQDAGLLAHGEQREPRGISFADLRKLPYLEAVIKEALRMYPVASGSLMRVADADMQLGDYHVPKGTHIQVPLHTLHNVEWTFNDPDKFFPERWMEESRWHKPVSLNETVQKKVLTGAPKSGGVEGAYMPFGAGPRECLAKGYTVQEDRIAAIGGQDVGRDYPGNAVAFMEVMTIIATIVANFRFRVSDRMGTRRQILDRQSMGPMLHFAGGLEMIFVPRATIGFSRNV
eukprot:jgi/Botrbrau1/2772/Bobra.0164s0049.1